MTLIDNIPRALHRGADDLPFVDLGDGSLLQLLHVDIEQGLWVIRTKFQPGYRVQTHKHTGTVYAFTLSGRWKYEEYPDVNTAGSYLFEPAGSIHTLTVPADNTEVTDVFFAINGANLNLDADGNVELVIDAGLIRDTYFALCEAQGLPRPDVILRDPNG
ncbi:MAG: 2,4'-dihydroxyacetophenone dioxygenase family protein [Acidimicrobiales bacterium]|jgi:quercetin dioxygenase-like cupin family protein|nr:2,4'-dihydroxyacetophenone dioxygenase family protein [Acidimicrobiales bacterium]